MRWPGQAQAGEGLTEPLSKGNTKLYILTSNRGKKPACLVKSDVFQCQQVDMTCLNLQLYIDISFCKCPGLLRVTYHTLEIHLSTIWATLTLKRGYGREERRRDVVQYKMIWRELVVIIFQMIQITNRSIYSTSPPDGRSHTPKEGEEVPPTRPLASRATIPMLAPVWWLAAPLVAEWGWRPQHSRYAPRA